MLPEVVLDDVVQVDVDEVSVRLVCAVTDEPLMVVTPQRLNYIQRLASPDYNENSLIIIELPCAPNKT